MKLFSGTANLCLAKEISALLKLPLSKAEVVRFANSEVRVTIKDNVKDNLCVLIQSTSNPTDTHLMELFFFADALKRSGAKKIIAVIPYFGYARQNIQHRPGEAVSTNVIIRFIEAIGFDQVLTLDLHDEATEGVFTIPFKNLSALPLLAETIKKYLKRTDNIAVVSPDQGGVERARKFADYLFQKFYPQKDYAIGVIEKKRNLDQIHQSKALNLYGEVKNKIVILVDDILTSGRTLVNAANLCLQRGAQKVYAVVVHPDLSPDSFITLKNSPLEKIFTTNTIALENKEKINNLIKSSVAGLLAQEIKTSFDQ